MYDISYGKKIYEHPPHVPKKLTETFWYSEVQFIHNFMVV